MSTVPRREVLDLIETLRVTLDTIEAESTDHLTRSRISRVLGALDAITEYDVSLPSTAAVLARIADGEVPGE